ncbi:AlpA family phage regulatory protein [Sphingomonas sp. TZW2008]|uniref:helix-turn-helix transcriptional regulator n=1 Tax=Sphingomonas sp. TZW2008 TaxID=1917973 RepID=UPI000A2684C0
MTDVAPAAAMEFWRLPRVIEVTGLSKSEIYRLIRLGTFPAPHAYRESPSRRFWVSTEVQHWQAAQIGQDEWDGLIS